MWLTESQVQLIIEALVPPELQTALDAEGLTHLVDRHDSMYLAHRNSQFPDPNIPGSGDVNQHEWRITPLVKGHGGGTDNATAPTHYSFKDPAVLASYMKKIKDAPEEWDEYSIHQMISSKNGPAGRRDGFGDKLYRAEPSVEPKKKEYVSMNDLTGHLAALDDDDKKQEESIMYEATIAKIVDGLLEDAVFPVEGMKVEYAADNEFKSSIQPHMDIHRRNKIATLMAGAVQNVPDVGP